MQSRMDNPETQVTLGKQDTGRRFNTMGSTVPTNFGMNPGVHEG